MDSSRRSVDIRPGERRQVAWAAGWFFCVLASYYVIRSIRETFGVEEGPTIVRWLYTGTFVAMLLATPLYGRLVQVTSKGRLPLVVYGFFVTNLAAFWLGFGGASPDAAARLRWAFYIWVSVFNLYIVAVFWSAAVELFSSEQAMRLFGLIAGADTLGGLAGAEASRLIVAKTGDPRSAMTLSALVLIAAMYCAARFRKCFPPAAAADATSGTPPRTESTLNDAWAGMLEVFRSRYLGALAALMILASVAGTGVYMQMTDFVRTQISDPVERNNYFARLNTYQNLLTFIGQTAAVGWVMRRLGLGVTLSIVPAVYALGFTAITVWPTLVVHGIVDVAQRVASFAAGVPAREVLFTVVSPDEKYRAKAFIDTAGKRAGDAVSAHAYAGLLAVGWVPATIAGATMPVALAIAVISLWLAREHARRAGRPMPDAALAV